MRKVLLLGVLILSLVGYAAAIQDDGLVLQTNGLLKNSFISGDITYSLYAPAGVNVFRLIKDVSLAVGETAQSIENKINDMRLKLYPDAEIILDVTAPKPPVGGIWLVKSLRFWNKITAKGQSWSYTYDASVAVFMTFVKSGKYNWYNSVNSVPWVYWCQFYYDNVLHCGGLCGNGFVVPRGLKVITVTAGKADYILWWFA